MVFFSKGGFLRDLTREVKSIYRKRRLFVVPGVLIFSKMLLWVFLTRENRKMFLKNRVLEKFEKMRQADEQKTAKNKIKLRKREMPLGQIR